MIPERRPIGTHEVDVIRAALERAAVAPVSALMSHELSHLEVVGRCDCGCASVDFVASPCDRRSTVVADATGRTPRGGQVGVIVWGRSDAVTGLEIYDLGAGDGDLVLPVSDSVVPWERSELANKPLQATRRKPPRA
jgi:hypothetical protein